MEKKVPGKIVDVGVVISCESGYTPNNIKVTVRSVHSKEEIQTTANFLLPEKTAGRSWAYKTNNLEEEVVKELVPDKFKWFHTKTIELQKNQWVIDRMTSEAVQIKKLFEGVYGVTTGFVLVRGKSKTAPSYIADIENFVDIREGFGFIVDDDGTLHHDARYLARDPQQTNHIALIFPYSPLAPPTNLRVVSGK